MKCHDCGCKIIVKDEKFENGVGLKYKDGDANVYVFKCHDCYKDNKRLNKFRSCEIYSRVVGYLRPIKQWNPGKQQEYKERKNYDI